MSKKVKVAVLGAIFAIIVGVTFSFGVFLNPAFNIRDFCANLSSEFIGWILAVTLFQFYYDEKLAARKKTDGTDGRTSTADEIVKYKNLLDSGAITREEYEQCKSRLLAG